jgi:serine/threonine protein kinase
VNQPAATSATARDPRDAYVGHTLDGKYRLEQLLGRGGMGAVFLGTHLGTGRFVAVKLITPEFMRDPECVERFKREARAAGRLRHPNIVDVTDFGVTQANNTSIAYLIMEYLDGCTLSQVLQEQKRLPLHWVVNILEQVCAAVHKAHEQGIIHRDLKPANIWLEPNTLGGFRVKVLDFGIAKLAEEQDPHEAHVLPGSIASPSVGPDEKTLLDSDRTAALPFPAPPLAPAPPLRSEAPGSFAPTAGKTPAPTEALTRVGAILGTPLFMSPEQCRGEALDARADIYSLGVIAYQMLSGTTPFTGETEAILRSHQHAKPLPLRKKGVRIPSRVARLVLAALAKDPNSRPQTALAFSNALRAGSETLGVLSRRTFAIYSEYFPKVIKLSLWAHIPVILASLLIVVVPPGKPAVAKLGPVPLEFGTGLIKTFATFVASSIISGVVAILVSQLSVAPLKPVTLRPAFAVLRSRWRPFLKTGLNASFRIYLGFIVLIVPGLLMMMRYLLWAPVVLLEDLEGRPALRRARELAWRSLGATLFATLFQLGVAGLMPWLVGRVIHLQTNHPDQLTQRALSELASLSSILVLPLLSILVTLVYLKMRQLEGEAPVPQKPEPPRTPALEGPGPGNTLATQLWD